MSDQDRQEAARRSDLVMKSALIRTQLAAHNTLLAWIRTAVSLYTFGFSISKFFQYLGQGEQGGAETASAPRNLGLALVIVGLGAVALASVEHVMTCRKLRELGMPRRSRLSLPVFAAAALLVIGVFACISILWRLPV